MKTLKSLGLTVAALGLLSTTAIAENYSKGMNNTHNADKRYTLSFTNADRDNDAYVTQAELGNIFMGGISDDVYASYDLNKDRRLNRAEFNRFSAKNMALFERNKAALQKADMINQKNAQKMERYKMEKAKWDKNAKAMQGRKIYLTMDFTVYDKNNDDLIDADELHQETGAVSPATEIAKYDANKDGRLNISEFKSYVAQEPVINAEISELYDQADNTRKAYN